jgi:uncharacterized delta-60 repeat protein
LTLTIRPRRLAISTFIAAVLGSAILSAAAQAAPGDLDPSFSGDGKQTTGFRISGSAANDVASAVAIQANGKIVVVGSSGSHATGSDFALARYNPNGSLDKSFSGDGRQRTGFGIWGPICVATAVAIQDDGKIVVVGFTHQTSYDYAFAIARYNPNGSLDPSFSGNGRQRTYFFGTDHATGVAIQGDGKIVVVGDAYNLTTDAADFAIARYNPDGSLDPSFSVDGRQTTGFGFGPHDAANGIAIQGDGRIVAAGNASVPVAKHGSRAVSSDFALARYNPNGTLDKSFSGNGREITAFGGYAGANAVALQGDGSIVAAGVDQEPPNYDFALARYNPDGSLDTSFSGNGREITGFGRYSEANAVALQADGNIVAAGKGRGSDGTSDFALARYLGG